MEERKVKTGGQERVEVANVKQKNVLKCFASSRAELLEEFPELLNSRDFKKSLRCETNLMKKIQLKEDQKINEVGGAEFNEVD